MQKSGLKLLYKHKFDHSDTSSQEQIALVAQMINKQFLRTSLIAVIIIIVCLCQHSVILEYFE